MMEKVGKEASTEKFTASIIAFNNMHLRSFLYTQICTHTHTSIIIKE